MLGSESESWHKEINSHPIRSLVVEKYDEAKPLA